MRHQDPHIVHRDLVTAYLLALAGLPFTLRVDAAGRARTMQPPVQPRLLRTVN
jgi:hypothetical protein